MEFIPVPEVAQVELLYDIEGQQVVNIMHYTGANVGELTTQQNLANNAFTMWGLTWQAIQWQGLHLTGIRVFSLETQNAPGYELTISASNAGGLSSEPLPLNCAILASMKTAYRGRSYRGRLYLPGCTTTQVNGSALETSTITAVANAFEDWAYLDDNGDPYGLVVVSRFHNGSPRSVGIKTPVTGWAANPYVCSQRRRLPGRGQ